MNDRRILSGVTVLDFTRVIAGPYCTRMMADMGANVVKIDAIPEDNGPTRTAGSPGNNMGKRSITLDPSTPQSAQTILQLAADADVLIEDYRPGEAAAWGWGPDALRAVNRDLVVASITPFGQDGPKAHWAAKSSSRTTSLQSAIFMITSGHGGEEFQQVVVGIAEIDRLAFAAVGGKARHRALDDGDAVGFQMRYCRLDGVVPAETNVDGARRRLVGDDVGRGFGALHVDHGTADVKR